jgi:hypothetical protein
MQPNAIFSNPNSNAISIDSIQNSNIFGQFNSTQTPDSIPIEMF